MDLIGRWFMARRFIGGLCGSRMTAKWNQSDATTLELVERQTVTKVLFVIFKLAETGHLGWVNQFIDKLLVCFPTNFKSLYTVL